MAAPLNEIYCVGAGAPRPIPDWSLDRGAVQGLALEETRQ